MPTKKKAKPALPPMAQKFLNAYIYVVNARRELGRLATELDEEGENFACDETNRAAEQLGDNAFDILRLMGHAIQMENE